MLMRNIIFFGMAVFMLLSFSANAQIAKDSIEKHLPGSWKIASEEDLQILKDVEELFLGENIRFQLNMRFVGEDESANREWNIDRENLILIMDNKLFEGAEYEIATISEKELVFNWRGKKVAYMRAEE